MEFPQLGKNCSCVSCKELDFLPITCTYCKLVFCKQHININQHDCQMLGSEKSHDTPVHKFICCNEDCESNSVVEMTCPKCKKHFCLEHRYHNCFELSQDDIQAKKLIWDSSKQQFAESMKDVNKIVNEGIKKALKNPKKQDTAQKINIMRLKAKSQGPNNIPSESRVYFSVVFMDKSKAQMCKQIFTSKDWSVGHVIDSICDLCNVPNKNNVANAKKLRLFKRSDGLQISPSMSVKIIDLLNENNIANGDTLILEYVNPDEDLANYSLINYHEYMD